MRVLIVKTSSLGDIIHTLPALSDARKHIPDICFDWVVEEAFAEIPRWHPAVAEVIPVGLRRWRKQLWASWRAGVWGDLRTHLRRHYYDHIIDAQGLLKSALLTWQARGLRSGLDQNSAREGLAAYFYQQRIAVATNQHAITRVRQLFAAVLGYAYQDDMPNYGLNRYAMTMLATPGPRLLFLHGTTWPTKHWPEAYWAELACHAASAGYRVRLPWGNEEEHERARRLAQLQQGIQVMPASSLASIAAEISMADAVIGVDTGLMHLAAAQGVPGITIYGATNPALTGTVGSYQRHLCATLACAPCLQRRCPYPAKGAVFPVCYEEISPTVVWDCLQDLLQQARAEILTESMSKNHHE
jgi:heptosyltransferase I